MSELTESGEYSTSVRKMGKRRDYMTLNDAFNNPHSNVCQ